MEVLSLESRALYEILKGESREDNERRFTD
jgi:hypothetical protein